MPICGESRKAGKRNCENQEVGDMTAFLDAIDSGAYDIFIIVVGVILILVGRLLLPR